MRDDEQQETGFFQDGPRLGNQFTDDVFLQSYLGRLVGDDSHHMWADLERFGGRVIEELLPIAHAMDQPRNQPFLKTHDAWGRRVDTIETSKEWKYMKRVAAEEGLVALGYDGGDETNSNNNSTRRLHQFAKLYLFGPSSGLFSCPLAMTDGAAKIMNMLLSDEEVAQRGEFKGAPLHLAAGVLEEAYGRLTSRNPELFWTSGQWMTERKGGSDVAAGCETVARLNADGTYSLYGYKWFTSATDSDVALTTARVEDSNGHTRPGTGGISCFLLHVKQPHSQQLNRLQVVRLKNKLGTRQLPTAELQLQGTKAYLLSTKGRGIAAITHMVNVTRLYNSVIACGYMRRILAINRDYAGRRVVFGALLRDNSLHLDTLAHLEVKLRGALALTLEAVGIMGKCEAAGLQENLLLRLLTPLCKLYTAKLCVSSLSEGVECMGGQGYVEDTGIPGLLRDAQVLPIWEGTTNVLAMDVIRVLGRSKFKALTSFREAVAANCRGAPEEPLLLASCDSIESFAAVTVRSMNGATGPVRDLAYSLARVFIGSLLAKHALVTQDEVDAYAAEFWCSGQVHHVGELVAKPLTLSATCLAERQRQTQLLALPISKL